MEFGAHIKKVQFTFASLKNQDFNHIAEEHKWVTSPEQQ